MTVSNTTTKLQYLGDGNNRTFAITFPLLSAAHLRVIITNAAGEETEVSANYELTPALNALTYPTVESGLAPLPAGSKITLIRQTPLTQALDLQSGNSLDAEELERGYDKLTYIVQELKEQLARALKYNESEMNEHTAEEYLKEIESASSSAAAYAQTASQAATASAAAASEAEANKNRAGGYCTRSETAANSAFQEAYNAGQFRAAAANSAADAQTAKTAAEAAKTASENAVSTATGQVSTHNTSNAAHADIRAAVAAKQNALPSGTAGQYLRKTAGGVEWTDIAAGGSAATVDGELSATSTNAVQNKVITAALAGKQKTLKAGTNTSIEEDGTINFVGGGGPGGTVDVDGSLSDTSTNPVQNKAIKAAIDAKQDKLNTTQTAAANSGITEEKVTAYDMHTADTDLHVSASEKATWTAKQDAISDLATIRQNASAGAAAANAAGNYGNIVSHNADEFQPSGNYAAASHTHTKDQITDLPTVPTKVSQLTNDSGFLTAVPAATASTLGGVKLSYDSATQTLTITAQ